MVHRFEGLCFVVALKVLLSLDPILILPLKSTNTHLCLLKHRCVFVLLPGVDRVGRLHLNLRTLMKVLMCKREDPTSYLTAQRRAAQWRPHLRLRSTAVTAPVGWRNTGIHCGATCLLIIV